MPFIPGTMWSNSSSYISKAWFVALAFLLVLEVSQNANAQQTEFAIETPGGQYGYTVDGTNLYDTAPFPGNGPTLNLPAGTTYTFYIDTAPNHPVVFVGDVDYPYDDSLYPGASPQDVNHDTVTLTIPATNYPSTLYYLCSIHGFYGMINVLPPPVVAPPANTIVSIALSPTSVTLKSTGTTTSYNLVPEYRSNLFTGTWSPVPVFTNVFSNGTNTTSFGRLEPLCGSNVFLRISQRPPL
jgi:plastocyanin